MPQSAGSAGRTGASATSPTSAVAYQERMGEAFTALLPGRDTTISLAVWRLIRAASLAERQIESAVHRPRNRTWASFRLLIALRSLGPTEPGTLSDILDIAPPSVSSLLATLERADHITRRPDPTNRRRVIVELTPAGAAAIDESIVPQADAEADFLDGLSLEQVELLSSTLDALLRQRWAQPKPTTKR